MKGKISVGYLSKNGLVGEYQGFTVYVVDYKDFTRDKDMGNIIYAVREPDSRELTLVLDGKVIGSMNDEGRINRIRGFKLYGYYQKPEIKVEKELPKIEVEKFDYSANYEQFSTTVDKFFEGLHELWKEMEV